VGANPTEVGSIKYWPVMTPPKYWLNCDGSAVSRNTYAALYTLIGTTYGAGDGTTTFNLPDLRGRFGLGAGQGASLTNRLLGAVGGEETHALTIAELAVHSHTASQGNHSHTIPDPGHNHSIGANAGILATGSSGWQFGGGSGGNWGTIASPTGITGTTAASAGAITIANAGSGSGHNTMPPFLVINFIIKATQEVPLNNPVAPIADTTTNGLLRQVSGIATDYVGGDNTCHPLPAAAANGYAYGGQLKYVSATQLSFAPFRGSLIRINGADYAIPAAGIAGLANTSVYIDGVACQNLAASTLYRVYCFNNAGTLTAEFSTTAHATSATPGNVGNEIKSGDDSRTLIGLALTGGTALFYDSLQYRYTRSWINRDRVSLSVGPLSVQVTATTATQTAANALFVCFANEALSASAMWYGTATAVSNLFFQAVLDGAGTSQWQSAVSTTSTTSKYETGTAVGAWNVSSEGQHTVSLYAAVSAANTATGTGTISGILG
jgi:microcystin-dependent protein